MTLSIQTVKQILDSVNTYTILFRKDKIVLANCHTLDWLNLAEEALLQYEWTDYVHPISQQLIRDTYKQILNGHDVAPLHLTIVHPITGNTWIDATFKAVDYLDEDDYWLVTFSPTIENRVYAEEVDTFHDDSLIENNLILSSVIHENRLSDNALNDFLDTLQDIVPYDSASITLLQAGELHFVATKGLPKEVFDIKFKPNKTMPKSGNIIYENTLGKVRVINDIASNPKWIAIKGTEHIKSWMGIELRYEGEMLGVLNLDSSQPDFFTEDYARYALALSQQAITAIVYTRLQQQYENDLAERNRLQKILVKNLINTETMYAAQELLFSPASLEESLRDLLNVICSSLDQTRLFLVIFNLPTGKMLHKVQSLNATDDMWHIFKEVIRQPHLIENTMPTTDLILSPNGTYTLDDGQKALAAIVNRRGIFLAVRDEDAPEFNDTDYELINTISNQISVALENEILALQLRQQNEQLERQIERRTQQLSVERKRLKAILDSTAEGIFYMENFTIQYANPAFCRMVGYGLDDLYGKPLSYVRVTPEDTTQRNIGNLLDNPQEVEAGRSETRLQHRDGTEFYASMRFSLVGQPGENPVRMVAIARDISQERKLYFQRARFIANAAHELRTPLSSIILRLHMLHRQPERLDTHLDSLDRVTQYLRELVEELLTLSRFERGTISLETSKHKLQDIIHEAIDEHRPFAIEQEVIIKVDLPEDDVFATVDNKRINQMIGNLVLNGINYSEKGDTVTVTMSTEEDMIGNKNAIIHVIDEGAGIEPDLLPDDIFEPFSRPSGGSRKETGMGLALVREIATLHGGHVHAHSILDEGATFRVSIPLD